MATHLAGLRPQGQAHHLFGLLQPTWQAQAAIVVLYPAEESLVDVYHRWGWTPAPSAGSCSITAPIHGSPIKHDQRLANAHVAACCEYGTAGNIVHRNPPTITVSQHHGARFGLVMTLKSYRLGE